jgi:hypothetical protein
MWHMPKPKPETEIERAQRQSWAPIAAKSVMGVTTKRGSAEYFIKPRGTYSAINPALVERNKERQLARFEACVAQLEPPVSCVRAKVTTEGNHVEHRTVRRA